MLPPAGRHRAILGRAGGVGSVPRSRRENRWHWRGVGCENSMAESVRGGGWCGNRQRPGRTCLRPFHTCYRKGRARMSKRLITIATAQSLISQDVRENGREVRRLMRQARSKGAAIAHFPESAMSGCSKAHIKSWDRFDWDALVDEL